MFLFESQLVLLVYGLPQTHLVALCVVAFWTISLQHYWDTLLQIQQLRILDVTYHTFVVGLLSVEVDVLVISHILALSLCQGYLSAAMVVPQRIWTFQAYTIWRQIWRRIPYFLTVVVSSIVWWQNFRVLAFLSFVILCAQGSKCPSWCWVIQLLATASDLICFLRIRRQNIGPRHLMQLTARYGLEAWVDGWCPLVSG